MSEATALTNQIIDYIYRQGGYAWRASSVGVYDGKIQQFRASAKKGVSDVLAVYGGHAFAIEVKIGKDRLSQEQEGFLKNFEHAGGAWYVAQYFDDFKLWFDQQVVLRDNSLCEDSYPQP